MIFVDYPYAETEQDACDIAKRRAREAGWRVLVVDEVYRLSKLHGESQRWVVRLRVTGR